jgi:monoamine oxidase
MSSKHYTCDTLIIGAGLAGISAARTLEAHNRCEDGSAPINYIVLEADNKIGGRAQSEIVKHDGANVVIHPGAEWIHRDVRTGTPENPLLQHVAPEDKLWRDTMPREFWKNGDLTKWKPNMERIGRARKVVDAYPHDAPDTDLAKLFEGHSLALTSELKTTFGEVETGAPLEDVSTRDVQNLVACNRGDFLCNGLGPFIKRYARDVEEHVRLNNPVERICWKPDGREGVEIHTKNGDVYSAKRLVLTVSIGVLKSGNIKFEPPLPEEYQANLANIEMGNFNKIFLFFDSKFKFPVNSNTHLDVHTKSGEDIFYLAKDNGQPLVTVFVGGALARICDKNPEKARDMAIQGLCEIWGDEVRDHIQKTPPQVTQWGENPLVQGGYSRVKIGHHDVREKLAEPIDGIIYPAGEAIGATHPESGRNWATHMAGAAISGERAANLVIKSLEKKRSITSRRQAGEVAAIT